MVSRLSFRLTDAGKRIRKRKSTPERILGGCSCWNGVESADYLAIRRRSSTHLLE